MPRPRYPSLFQVNTRVRLSERSTELGRPATLDDIPEGELDRLAADGFDLVWLLGVWQTGEAARRVSASDERWLEEYRRVLPDFRESDVCGSCFAIREYRVHDDFGGDAALARLRERLAARGLRLVLDFVPNHVAPDHPWVYRHPEWFVGGTPEQRAARPRNYGVAQTAQGERILAFGRDPYFDGWPDTFQLDYGQPALQEAMREELLRVARRCDGVRCDMAMLVLPEVFEKTLGIASSPFWPGATAAVRAEVPGFLFLAEVYWDLEWTLQQQGFDYTYDKRLYDRLATGPAGPVRDHLRADAAYQDRMARFLENHDEPRAAATFAPGAHRAAAVATYFVPGLRFFHQGQREGKRARIPVHLARGPAEPPDRELSAFYETLLAALRDESFRDGRWRLLEGREAWEGNPTVADILAFSWEGPGKLRRLVAVNDSDHRAQCFVGLPWGDLAGRRLRFRDRLGPEVHDRDGDDLAARGLFLDLPAWGCHVFDVAPARG